VASYDQVIIGGGLSGLAAGIRLARFGYKVLILEKHSVSGGLNSYYYRHGRLFETGLHAMTNFAPPGLKHAPLNRLFRQLKLPRKEFVTHEQLRSTILFPSHKCLSFSNNLDLLISEVNRGFPEDADRFMELIRVVRDHDPFVSRPWTSAKEKLKVILRDEQLVNMLLWPLMMYGCSNEHDMDFDQFVIMFNAIFLEGFFRPAGTIRDFLSALLNHYQSLGGEIKFKAAVSNLNIVGNKVNKVVLESGEEIAASQVISTAGYPATLKFMGEPEGSALLSRYTGRMSFVEMIYVLPASIRKHLHSEDTIVFYNFNTPFDYRRPSGPVDCNCGVICFPDNFHGVDQGKEFQLRVTHPANYDLWRNFTPEEYNRQKILCASESEKRVSEIVGNYRENVLYQDTFTPVTIEKFTGKAAGAVYGSPVKVRDGLTPVENLYVAGTDQGYLGIVGAMLSGVTMVNQHIFENS